MGVMQEISGYDLSPAKIAGTFILVLFTFGLALVLITWRKTIKVRFKLFQHLKCSLSLP